jgi:AcrR family transcriptional regulator
MTADERRESVLEAALTEFAARGLDGTSTEDVARRAGISQPYLFRLFPTKKALFLALVRRSFQRVADTFAKAAAGRVGEDALQAMGDAYGQLLEDRTLLLLQMHAYGACDDPDIRDATRAAFRELWLLVERLTGQPYDRIVEFFAMGMLLNVAAAMDLPAVDERWASWCRAVSRPVIFFQRKS